MLSVASAAAIGRRLDELLPALTPAALLAANDEGLRAVGLSKGKIRTLRAVAQAMDSGALELKKLEQASTGDIRKTLMALPGIGPWTADIYLLFCLGHADGFAPGDLALQVSAQHMMGLEERPKPKQLEQLAARWQPWRGVAARQLWHYTSWRRTQEFNPI
jgi:DNA-3-methyladenine glycosylase II